MECLQSWLRQSLFTKRHQNFVTILRESSAFKSNDFVTILRDIKNVSLLLKDNCKVVHLKAMKPTPYHVVHST